MAVSTRTRFEVLKRDDFTCRYCGRKPPEVKLHVDHIVPVSKGGTDDFVNLVTACQDCNLGKSAKELTNKTVRHDANQLAEEMRATRQYLAEREEFAQWREDALRSVYRHWDRLWNDPVPQGPWPNTVRKWLEHYGPTEITEAMDKAIDKISAGKSSANATNVLRYLHGIMRNKLAGTFEQQKPQVERPMSTDSAFSELWKIVVPITIDSYDGCPEAAWPEVKRHVYDELGVNSDAFVPIYFAVFDDCACERCYGPLLEEVAA